MPWDGAVGIVSKALMYVVGVRFVRDRLMVLLMMMPCYLAEVMKVVISKAFVFSTVM
jgi:hypothetical protein